MHQGGIHIHGNVGYIINAESGAGINVYLAPHSARDVKVLNRSVHLLLRKCELTGIRRLMEHISFVLYGTRLFKALSPGQIAKLHAIADEIAEVFYVSQGRRTVPARRVSASPTV